MPIQEPTSVKGCLQKIIEGSEAMGVIEGRVISERPLKIQVINDEKLVLHEGILEVPEHLTTYWTRVDITAGSRGVHSGHLAGDGGHSHLGATMIVHNALRLGDIVYILSFNHGKKYLVFDRKG